MAIAAIVLRGLDEAREALGYQVGAELLRRAVEDLGQVMHADALIARTDGDELVVAQPIDPSLDVDAVASALAAELIDGIGAGRYVVSGIEVSLRAHVGLAIAPDDAVEITELLRLASLSARQAIDAGVRSARWDGKSPALTAKDLAVLSDLRLAPERGEMWVAYQPQISPLTRRPVSVEALLRWTSPVHGFVPPGVFIPLAERTGLIDRLTTWVFDEALDAQARWRARGVDLPVSINLSPLSLFDPAIASTILFA
ncbi:MAG: EAL domain-containing protein, partial [Ilumatobacteraceae bacterium]